MQATVALNWDIVQLATTIIFGRLLPSLWSQSGLNSNRQIHPSHKTSVSCSLQQSVTPLQFVKFLRVRQKLFSYRNLLKVQHHLCVSLQFVVFVVFINRQSNRFKSTVGPKQLFQTKRSISMWFTVKQWKCNTQLSRCQCPNVIHLNENPFHAAYQKSKILTQMFHIFVYLTSVSI